MPRVYVYEEFAFGTPEFMGILYTDVLRGREHISFEFDKEWLERTRTRFFVDPDLCLLPGRQYPAGKNMFGMFADASPDRWGRTLMERRERLTADREGRKPRKLNDSDYLLGVYDETRVGALRFKDNPDGAFVSDDQEMAVPPWIALRTLEEASRNFENEKTAMQEMWLNQLIRPGSSLGGARPKATVRDPDGALWIAKFPSQKDDYDVGAWEKTVYDLARLCGLNVSESKLEKFSRSGSTFLVKRFDREGKRRVHFASAMTMLGKTDGAEDAEGTGYLDIASFLKSYGACPKEDLIELWKRIVFNMAITNTDDHLRNHGFLLTQCGWRLSPLYDVNPVPYGDTLSLMVDGDTNEISIPTAVAAAPYYGIDRKTAGEMAETIRRIVGTRWEKVAAANGLSREACRYMRPAFDACFPERKTPMSLEEEDAGGP